mmetsp:Transcript_124775/g.388418  ORF Transcript_124775/g.388418 Transcript_124775/m.388418 type:complete len:288 (+) Transcript_124775:876-1739(+)
MQPLEFALESLRLHHEVPHPDVQLDEVARLDVVAHGHDAGDELLLVDGAVAVLVEEPDKAVRIQDGDVQLLQDLRQVRGLEHHAQLVRAELAVAVGVYQGKDLHGPVGRPLPLLALDCTQGVRHAAGGGDGVLHNDGHDAHEQTIREDEEECEEEEECHGVGLANRSRDVVGPLGERQHLQERQQAPRDRAKVLVAVEGSERLEGDERVHGPVPHRRLADDDLRPSRGGPEHRAEDEHDPSQGRHRLGAVLHQHIELSAVLEVVRRSQNPEDARQAEYGQRPREATL